jgi:hypothetical protein
MPMVVMAFKGSGRSAGPMSGRRIAETARITREIYTYLWTGPAAADPIPVREAYVRERFSVIMASSDSEIPQGTFDPLIEHVAEVLAQSCGASESGPSSPSNGR